MTSHSGDTPHGIEPPPNLDPALARVIEELARAAVRRQRRVQSKTPSEKQFD